ncbi:MAG TPA: TonB-dependent receptor [Sphingomonas sp.]|nr:TonB-dependent receptor [Sphingomonas sp.]
MNVHHIDRRLAHARRLARLGLGASALALVVGGTATAAHAQTSDTAVATDSDTQARQTSDKSTTADIVVTGQRASINNAIQIKRNANEIVDSITADDIGKLPDRSVTETLQRVTGVTIDHFIARNDPDHYSVEGSGVNIRGLTYVRSELNGRDAFSANGGRTLSFEDVPPELLAGVDVYKNPTADHIEGGIGGLVNLRTRMPFDSPGQVLSLSYSGSLGDLRNQLEPSFSGLYSNRWQTPIGEVGVLVDAAFSRSATRTDAVQVEPYYPRTDLVPGQTVYIPKGVDWRQLDFTRRRFGLYGALQWKPADNLDFETTYFQSSYKFHWDEHAIFTATNAYNIVPAPGTEFTYDDKGAFLSGVETDPNPADGGGMPFNDDVRSADQKAVTTEIAGSLTWRPTDRLTVTADVQHVHATNTGLDSTVATGVILPSEKIDLSHGLPSVEVDPAYLADTSNYYWAFTMDERQHNVANEWAYRGDVSYDLDTGGLLKKLSVGARMTNLHANNKGSPYNWQAVSQTWQLGWLLPRLAYLSEFPLASQQFQFGSNFYHGGANVPLTVVFPATSQATGYPDSYFALHDITTQLCEELNGVGSTTCPAFNLTAYGDAQTNIQREKTYALYGMLDFSLADSGVPLSGNLGLRWSKTDSAASGFIVEPSQIGGAPPGGPVFNGASSPIVAKNHYDYLLPSLDLLYRITPKLQARLAVGRAMARPDFSTLQAFTQLSASYSTTTGYNFDSNASSNPYLKPILSDQIDGTLEWYFGTASSLTGAVFYKHLKNIIRNVASPYEFNGQTYNLVQPQNVGTADVKGVEIGYNQAFTFLPGFLSGFGITSNFTYVDSSTHVDTSSLQANSAAFVSANGVDTNGAIFGKLPLEGLSKYSYNLTGYYEKGIVSIRLAYNWRSKYLLATNVNGTQGSDGSPLASGGVDCGDPNTPAASRHCVVWGLPTWNGSYGELDGSIFFKFNHDKISFGLEAQNLTNSVNRVLMQQSIGLKGRAWFQSDRRYTASVRVTF